ncbi:gluconate 2-dehydrogenase subunit 3 family protein [Halalkalicoccus sp. NIPERK01]|uniref:gluconate 2-dehydrogenase subunit 3 family protein n=1 Tax=Halalkalicoccus sp. NIPERK01 TaxID=3053469 RepID=UPI00256EEECA|nr:gluconate 2-dehydrogenase subunit 3 family protein [Halalkalicoccus sp. NIPERK01]MDL5362434.1 gluconate 2-dehydrogenase subunit 3 family protein [Halalkalicoccus sp. NIPERK01]
MELSRRDAMAALGALGVGAAALGVRERAGSGSDEGPDARVREAFVAAAEVVYPSEVSGVRGFVETFLEGRLDDGTHAEGLRAAVSDLDDAATEWYDGRFSALSPADRDRLLREIGADTAEEDPEGTTAERVRYYVVNELLLALYSSPTGGELVGIENPQGHPGGIESYRRGPEA